MLLQKWKGEKKRKGGDCGTREGSIAIFLEMHNACSLYTSKSNKCNSIRVEVVGNITGGVGGKSAGKLSSSWEYL